MIGLIILEAYMPKSTALKENGKDKKIFFVNIL